MDADRAEMAAIANAKASVIFVSMVGLLCAEAGSGFCRPDRGTRRLFLHLHSHGVHSVKSSCGGSYRYELSLRPNAAAVGSPYTASRCHHGIVMDSARFNLEQRVRKIRVSSSLQHDRGKRVRKKPGINLAH